MLFLKRVIKKLFAIFNLEVKIKSAPDNAYHHNYAMIAGLQRLKKAGFEFTSIVDVGAAQGAWSLSASALWPAAKYLLFEPLDERQAELKSIASKHPNFFIAPFAAGSKDGEITFSVSDDLDGSGVASSGSSGNLRTILVKSIQDQATRFGLNGSFLVKLDTHGYEVPIIEGCRELLPKIDAFIIETYGFQIADGSLLFWEMCRHMNDLGFRLYDVVDVMNREKDGAFWQCDAFFIRKEHRLFNDNKYA